MKEIAVVDVQMELADVLMREGNMEADDLMAAIDGALLKLGTTVKAYVLDVLPKKKHEEYGTGVTISISRRLRDMEVYIIKYNGLNFVSKKVIKKLFPEKVVIQIAKDLKW